FTQRASLPLYQEVALDLRRASRLSSGVPEAAVVKPGSSKITHEPFSISVRRSGRDFRSVTTLISSPARTLVSPPRVNSLPLLATTIGGGGGPAGRPNTPP